MINDESLASEDNLMKLRSKIKQESIQSFRSKLIGGLNEKDVIEYISGIEYNFQQKEQELKREADELLTSRNKLQRELEICKTINKEENKSLQASLDKAENDLASYIDECKNKDLTLQSITEERKDLEQQIAGSRLEIEQLKEYADGVEQENNALKSKIADFEKGILPNDSQNDEIKRVCQELEQTKQELQIEKTLAASYKISGFKEEFISIYQQLESLTEEQVKTTNELQQQLEFEQLRANKAENSLAELIKWVSELKDKLSSEQNLFETQFKQIEERYTIGGLSELKQY